MSDRNRTRSTILIVLVVVLLVVAGVWALRTQKEANRLRAENDKLRTSISYVSGQLAEYQDALQEANTMIEDAQSLAWSSYQEMGETLEGLYRIQEP